MISICITRNTVATSFYLVNCRNVSNFRVILVDELNRFSQQELSQPELKPISRLEGVPVMYCRKSIIQPARASRMAGMQIPNDDLVAVLWSRPIAKRISGKS